MATISCDEQQVCTAFTGLSGMFEGKRSSPGRWVADDQSNWAARRRRRLLIVIRARRDLLSTVVSEERKVGESLAFDVVVVDEDDEGGQYEEEGKCCAHWSPTCALSAGGGERASTDTLSRWLSGHLRCQRLLLLLHRPLPVAADWPRGSGRWRPHAGSCTDKCFSLRPRRDKWLAETDNKGDRRTSRPTTCQQSWRLLC